MDSTFRPPAAVKILAWLFLDQRRRGFFGKMMISALRLKRKPESPQGLKL
jgi:hypothetical protein